MPHGPSASGAMAASSSTITEGGSSSRIRRAAAKLVTDATRNPAMLASNSRRAAAHSAASSLTTNTVCSRFSMALSIPRCVFSRRLFQRNSLARMATQHPVNFFRQLFHPKWLGHVRQPVAFQKLPSLCGNDVAGHEEEFPTQRISRAFKRLVEILSIECRHFHVADNEIKFLVPCPIHRLPAIQQDVD